MQIGKRSEIDEAKIRIYKAILKHPTTEEDLEQDGKMVDKVSIFPIETPSWITIDTQSVFIKRENQVRNHSDGCSTITRDHTEEGRKQLGKWGVDKILTTQAGVPESDWSLDPT